MRQEVRNQHYVPQFYLKKFSEGEKKKEKIYVFNKKKLTIKRKRVSKIASKDFFYDFEKEILGEDYSEDSKQFLEEYFGKVESKSSRVFKTVEEKIRNCFYKNRKIKTSLITGENKITLLEKKIISKFLTLQHVRTDSFREVVSHTYKLLLEKATMTIPGMEDLKKVIHEKKVELIINEVGKKEIHQQMILESLKIEEQASCFFNRVWIFQYNNTEKNYCTSDNPIGIIQERNLGAYGVGIATADILVFPISNRINLCMFHPALFEENFSNIIEECYFQNELDVNEVEKYNLNQAFNCNIEVYSLDQDFDRIKKECEKNNHNIQLSPNERVEVF